MEVNLITLLATIFVFGLLVFVHELGHFLAAKATGMKVEEFAIGFGPVLYQQRDGETLYSLRLIPLESEQDQAKPLNKSPSAVGYHQEPEVSASDDASDDSGNPFFLTYKLFRNLSLP